MSRTPLPALVLGYAGLLPPLAGIALELSLRDSSDPDFPTFVAAVPVLCYTALILSFLGGMWWGAASARSAPQWLPRWLVLAVMPVLIVFGAVLFGWLTSSLISVACVLAFGLLLSLMVDQIMVRERVVPAWWMWLRIPLSIGLALETLATVLFA